VLKTKQNGSYTHTSSQPNAAWQNDSQREELAIPSGAQLYYKRFLRGIPISGTFGEHLVKCLHLLCGEFEDGKHGNLSSCEIGFPVGAAFFSLPCLVVTGFTQCPTNGYFRVLSP